MFTSLGIVLFHALDYGLCEDDERPLSKPLELLIQRLTSAHEIARRQKRAHQQQQARSSRSQSQNQEMHSLGSFYDDDHLDDEDADEDEYDECANADEGIERDCHDETPRSSAQSNSHLVNFDQVLQV